MPQGERTLTPKEKGFSEAFQKLVDAVRVLALGSEPGSAYGPSAGMLGATPLGRAARGLRPAGAKAAKPRPGAQARFPWGYAEGERAPTTEELADTLRDIRARMGILLRGNAPEREPDPRTMAQFARLRGRPNALDRTELARERGYAPATEYRMPVHEGIAPERSDTSYWPRPQYEEHGPQRTFAEYHFPYEGPGSVANRMNEWYDAMSRGGWDLPRLRTHGSLDYALRRGLVPPDVYAYNRERMATPPPTGVPVQDIARFIQAFREWEERD